MTAMTAEASLPRTNSVGRAVVAATIGNMMEWYDFTIYAAFAFPISKAFFPAGDETTSLLQSLIVFGIGFIARPFGAIFLGSYADRRGRRDALSLTIFLMAIGTGMIAFCPSYASIGIAAPLVILVARLLQGFSAGGEIGGAVSMLVEYAPPEKRGFYAAFQQLSQGGATMFSGLVSITIALSMSDAAVTGWGWRIAFAVGLVIAPVGIYIRRTLEDAPGFRPRERHPLQPVKAVLGRFWPRVLAGMGVILLWTVAQYITNFFPTYASRELKMSLSNSYFGPFVVGIVLLFCPLVGMLADRFRRRNVMMFGAAALFLVAYPAFHWLVANPTLPWLVVVQVAVAVCMLIYTAPATAVLAELFPTEVRATGVSLTYSLGVALFGGFTPYFITQIISLTGQKVSIAFLLMAAAAVSFVTIGLIADRTGEQLS
jgi:MHS family proline/betaine transporter-like MFS transporter